MKNIRNLFEIPLGDKTVEIKANFGVLEALERRVLNKPIFDVIDQASEGKIYVTDIIDVLYLGLLANNDTRFTREQVGNFVIEKGSEHYIETYLKFLTSLITTNDMSQGQENILVNEEKKN